MTWHILQSCYQILLADRPRSLPRQYGWPLLRVMLNFDALCRASTNLIWCGPLAGALEYLQVARTYWDSGDCHCDREVVSHAGLVAGRIGLNRRPDSASAAS